MKLKIASLNVGRFYDTPDSLSAVRFLTDPLLDAVCIQGLPEFVVRDEQFRKRWPVGHFAPMTNHFMQGGVRVPVGIGIFSRELPFVSLTTAAYVGNVLPVSDLDPAAVTIGPDGNASAEDAVLLEKCESRLAIFATVQAGKSPLTIGTTHGPWRPGGVVDYSLRQAMRKFVGIVASQRGDLVLAGDFNIERNSEIYHGFLQSGLRDRIPPEVVNTIDWNNRGTQGPDLVVDYIFTRGDAGVSDVELHFGLSKHAAISAVVELA